MVFIKLLKMKKLIKVGGCSKMNQVIETIKNRRSVREYQETQITDEELEKILESAIHAPTGHNDQPWHFTILQDKDLINQINDGAKEVMSQMDVKWISQMGQTENLHIFHKAPTVIIVSARKDAVTPIPDCSAAVQNMLLSAESMDIGSCWIGFAKFHFLKIENRKNLIFQRIMKSILEYLWATKSKKP